MEEKMNFDECFKKFIEAAQETIRRNSITNDQIYNYFFPKCSYTKKEKKDKQEEGMSLLFDLMKDTPELANAYPELYEFLKKQCCKSAVCPYNNDDRATWKETQEAVINFFNKHPNAMISNNALLFRIDKPATSYAICCILKDLVTEGLLRKIKLFNQNLYYNPSTLNLDEAEILFSQIKG